MTIKIPLTRGYFAIIDAADAHLAAFNWYATVGRSGVVYATRNDKSDGVRRTVYLHREIIGVRERGEAIVDHIDGDGLNCKRRNLRLVTNPQNIRNVAGARIGSASNFLGVRRNKSRWQAHIKVDGVHRHIGNFTTPEEAHYARLVAEMRLVGIEPRRRAAFEAVGLA